MKPSLNGVIFGTGLSFEEQVRLASDVGFAGIDTGIEAIAHLIDQRGLTGAREFFDACAVQPAVWGFNVDWRGSNDSYRESLDGLTRWAEVAREIGCPRCCTWLPPSVDDAAALRKLAVKRFRESAEILAAQGCRLGLEWVGPKTSRQSGQEFIYRMDQLLEMIDEIGRPNVGLLVDSFHWFTAGHTVEELVRVPKERVVHVHINDAPDRPRDEQIDMERLLPGEGVIDLAGFLGALRQIGYEDYMGVETFSAELKALTPSRRPGEPKPLWIACSEPTGSTGRGRELAERGGPVARPPRRSGMTPGSAERSSCTPRNDSIPYTAPVRGRLPPRRRGQSPRKRARR